MRKVLVAAALLGAGCFSEAGEVSEGGSSESTAGTTSSSTAGTVDTTMTTSPVSSSADGSSGVMPGPFCGDGFLDEGEECDDGNDVDADGCNNDCQPSFSVVWATVLDPGVGGESFRAVAALEDGGAVAGGYSAGMTDRVVHRDANAVVFDPSGTVTSDEDLIPGPVNDDVWALLRGPSGEIYAAGSHSDDGTNDSVAWLGILDGGVLGPYDEFNPSMGRDAYYGLVISAGQLFAVGHVANGTGVGPWLQPYSLEGVRADGGEEVVPSDADMISLCAAATADEHGIYLAGYRRFGEMVTEGFIRQRSGNTFADATGMETFTVGVAVARPGDPDSPVWTVGWSRDEAAVLTARLAIVPRNGTVATTIETYPGDLEEGATYEKIAVDGAGNIVVVGSSVVDTALVRAPLIRKFAPDGEELWTLARVDDVDFGGLTSVAIGEGDRIYVAGNAVPNVGNQPQRFAAVLRP